MVEVVNEGMVPLPNYGKNLGVSNLDMVEVDDTVVLQQKAAMEDDIIVIEEMNERVTQIPTKSRPDASNDSVKIDAGNSILVQDEAMNQELVGAISQAPRVQTTMVENFQQTPGVGPDCMNLVATISQTVGMQDELGEAFHQTDGIQVDSDEAKLIKALSNVIHDSTQSPRSVASNLHARSKSIPNMDALCDDFLNISKSAQKEIDLVANSFKKNLTNGDGNSDRGSGNSSGDFNKREQFSSISRKTSRRQRKLRKKLDL